MVTYSVYSIQFFPHVFSLFHRITLFKTIRFSLYAQWDDVNSSRGGAEAPEDKEQARLARSQPQRITEAEGGGRRRRRLERGGQVLTI